MHLSVLSSLGLMLVLMASLLHLAAMFTSGWTRARVFLPSRGHGQPASSSDTPRETQGLDSSLPWGQAKYLRIDLWLWDWCQDLRELSPECHTTGSLQVVQGLEVLTLLSLGTCLILLQRVCHLTSDVPRRKTFLQVSAAVLCFLTFGLLVAAIAIFVTFVHRDVTHLLSAADWAVSPQTPFTPQLGWPVGADGVSAVVAALGGVLLCFDLRATSRRTVPYVLVV